MIGLVDSKLGLQCQWGVGWNAAHAPKSAVDLGQEQEGKRQESRDYSILILASLTTCPHLLISDLIKRLNSSGLSLPYS